MDAILAKVVAGAREQLQNRWTEDDVSSVADDEDSDSIYEYPGSEDDMNHLKEWQQ